MEKKVTKKAAKVAEKKTVKKAVKAPAKAAKSKTVIGIDAAKKGAKDKTVEVKKAPAGYCFGEIKMPRQLKHTHSDEWYTAHKYDSQWFGQALDALDSLIEVESYKLAAVAARATIKDLIGHLKEQEKAARKAK